MSSRRAEGIRGPDWLPFVGTLKEKEHLMQVHEVRDFSKRGDALPVPNLVEVQIESYQRFLQMVG